MNGWYDVETVTPSGFTPLFVLTKGTIYVSDSKFYKTTSKFD